MRPAVRPARIDSHGKPGIPGTTAGSVTGVEDDTARAVAVDEVEKEPLDWVFTWLVNDEPLVEDDSVVSDEISVVDVLGFCETRLGS
jgi:hypothetical protein